METRTKEQYNKFLSQLKQTNTTLDFFCDFEKIGKNVESIAIKLNQLNYLIGKNDLTEAIKNLWDENPKVFSILEILIAIRHKDKKQVISNSGNIQFLDRYFESVDGVIEFINETGLGELFVNKKITNLVDYVFGVETGLDTNARKNRSGKQMENTIESILRKSGIKFRREVYSKEFPQISKMLGTDEKRFDFVLETHDNVFLTEVNFYSGGGSKLNEVARAYTEIGPKINNVSGYEFVWITDGIGWHSAKNKLEEAFYTIPRIYNLTTFNEFIKEIKDNG
ncbi:MAG: type II restriction endonuclease [Prevotella sp.]|nr:type II restriction endonuclease [Prevotella sp.]